MIGSGRGTTRAEDAREGTPTQSHSSQIILVYEEKQVQNPGLAAGNVPSLQGYLAHKKQRSTLGAPCAPRYSPTVGSWGGAVSYERGTPVLDHSSCGGCVSGITLDATQGKISSQSPTDATSGSWHLNRS